MNNGLTTNDIETIHNIFRKYPNVRLVFLFGSRAKGNYKKGSDIDLAIMNKGVNIDTIFKIKREFEESSLPYFVDLINYFELEHKELREHIDRIGIEFYKT